MLQRHMKEHEDVYACDICGFKCGRKPGIMIHIYRKHVPAKPDIKCEDCHKAYVEPKKKKKSTRKSKRY